MTAEPQKKSIQLNPVKVTAKLLDKKTIDDSKMETKAENITIRQESDKKHKKGKSIGYLDGGAT